MQKGYDSVILKSLISEVVVTKSKAWVGSYQYYNYVESVYGLEIRPFLELQM